MPTSGRPTPAPETGVVVARPSVATSGIVMSIIAGVVITIFGLILAGGQSGFGLLVAFMVVVVGLSMAALPLWLRIEAVATKLTGWHNPTLEITPWPLHLGSPAFVVYRRRPAKANTLKKLAGSPNALAELVCEEWVQYTVGTSTHTETEEVVRLPASIPGQTTGDGFEAVFDLTVPVDTGGPTLSLSHNRVTWWLETRLGEPFGWRTSTKVDLVIPPVIDRAAVVGEGGMGANELQ